MLRFRYRLRERRERVAQDLGALKSALERRPARLAARLESARRALAAFPRMAELSRKADAVANRRRQLEDRMGFSLARRTGQLRDCGEKLGLVTKWPRCHPLSRRSSCECCSSETGPRSG